MSANRILHLPTDADIGVAPMYHQYGRHPEDGTPIIGDRLHVWVTLPDGTRYEHFKTFHSMVLVRDDECEFGYYFDDIYEEANAAAQWLAEAVRRNGQICLTHWHEIDPSYGSEQFISQGIEQQRAFQDRFDD